MARNAERRASAPRIELLTGAASETEAAAIVAALERFFADTTPAAPRRGPEQSPWQRAALRQGVSRSEGLAPSAHSD
jgi:hypothetical protein